MTEAEITLAIFGPLALAVLFAIACLIVGEAADRAARRQAALAYARRQRICAAALEHRSRREAAHDPSEFTSARWLHDHERVAYWDAVLAEDWATAVVIRRWTENLRRHIDSLPERPKVTVVN